MGNIGNKMLRSLSVEFIDMSGDIHSFRSDSYMICQV